MPLNVAMLVFLQGLVVGACLLFEAGSSLSRPAEEPTADRRSHHAVPWGPGPGLLAGRAERSRGTRER